MTRLHFVSVFALAATLPLSAQAKDDFYSQPQTPESNPFQQESISFQALGKTHEHYRKNPRQLNRTWECVSEYNKLMHIIDTMISIGNLSLSTGTNETVGTGFAISALAKNAVGPLSFLDANCLAIPLPMDRNINGFTEWNSILAHPGVCQQIEAVRQKGFSLLALGKPPTFGFERGGDGQGASPQFQAAWAAGSEMVEAACTMALSECKFSWAKSCK